MLKIAKKIFTDFDINVMEINYNDTTPFNAKFINHVKVKNLAKNTGKYESTYASFLEIDPKNKSDVEALEKISNYWEKASFATNIYQGACALRNENQYYKGHKIYALTTQKKNFDKLDWECILGLAHIDKSFEKYAYLEHLQGNPEYIFSKNREYKGIGSGILTSLKRIYNNITLIAERNNSVRRFYEKNDF